MLKLYFICQHSIDIDRIEKLKLHEIKYLKFILVTTERDFYELIVVENI